MSTEERLRAPAPQGSEERFRSSVALWSPPDPATVIRVQRVPTWAERARRHRREVADHCELCEKRSLRIYGNWWRRPALEVHHRNGRGIVSPVGLESMAELQTLCKHCHGRITREHRRRGKARGELNGRGRVVFPAAYSRTIAEVSAEAHSRYVIRAVRRLLRGVPGSTNQRG